MIQMDSAEPQALFATAAAEELEVVGVDPLALVLATTLCLEINGTTITVADFAAGIEASGGIIIPHFNGQAPAT